MTTYSLTPLITIVIPTYNRKDLLQKSIRSVLAQTYTHWELIIVDDGSDDGTGELIKRMFDDKIRIIQLPHSGHIGRLFNTGVKAGNGELLAFLASDDVWVPHKLELQLKTLRKENTRWCYGNYELMNESGETIAPKSGKYYPFSGKIIKQLLTTDATVSMCTVLLERSLFEEVNGFSTDSRLLYRGDYELALRLAMTAEVTALSDILARVLEHAGRATNGLKDGCERTALAYEIFLDSKPAKELRRIAKRRRGSQLAEACSQKLQNGKYLQGCRLFAKAVSGGVAFKQLFGALFHGMKSRLKTAM